jgi:hypothetical protein
MKSFLRRILIFFLFNSIFYFVLIGIWGFFVPSTFRRNLIYNPQEGFLATKVENIKKYENVDILFLGSSHAYRGFDTRIFKENNIHSFNLGSSAQTHIQTNYFLKTYLEGLNPKLVVYEVYPAMFSNQGVESTINIVSAENEINLSLLDLLYKTRDIRVLNTFILSLYNPSVNNEINPIHSEIDRYVEGGFVEKKIAYNSEIPVNRDWKPLQKQIKAFKNNIEYLKSRNIPFILVQAPYTYHYNNKDVIESFFSKFRYYYNFNNILDLSPTKDFYDDSHLNQHGVKKFNDEFIKIINSHKLLNN